MIEKFNTLFSVKSSLISLYLALTIPIPFISIDNLKKFSIIIFLLGLFLIIKITGDYVETSDRKISYKTNWISRTFGRKNWEILWKDIKLIKSLPTSQGSSVYYFITSKGDNYLIPQRIENFGKFLTIISTKTGIEIKDISYISPLWTYKLLTFLSVLMIIGEFFAYKNQMLSMLNL
tara:strand:+ start:5 stop:535 length:531 start_codon:yes stop_codon:yes gene_type:complete